MAEINLKLPELLQHVEYLDSLVLRKIEYEEEFEQYLQVLNVKVELVISSSLAEQVVNTMTEKDGAHELRVPIKRYWISPGKLTSLPTPKAVHSSVIFALNSALKDFKENDSETNFEENLKVKIFK